LPGPLLGGGTYFEIRFHCSSVKSISPLNTIDWARAS
jgi:hypothetical protein